MDNYTAMWETWVRSLGWEDPLEKEMAIHSRTIAWEIPWTEEHGVLQSMGLQKVWIRPNNNYNNILHLLTYSCNAGDPGSTTGLGRSPGEGNGNPLQDYCLENPMDRGAWWATAHGVAKSQT